MKQLGMRWVLVGILGLILVQGCATEKEKPTTPTPTDYVGSQICQGCHGQSGGPYDLASNSGHTHILTRVNGQKPGAPLQLPDNPPDGVPWSQIAYVIGGFAWRADFVKTGNQFVTGDNAQHNLPLGQLPAGLGPLTESSQTAYNYECFRCHTTGPDQAAGTFSETGVQCETCHGPGAEHASTGDKEKIRRGDAAAVCQQCHSRNTGSPTPRVVVESGFVADHSQYDELHHGQHESLKCLDCHYSHKGVRGGQIGGLKKDCGDAGCHAGVVVNHAAGAGTPVCVDCHMPRAGKSGRSLNVYAADVRSHIFKIHSGPDPKGAMFETVGSTSYVKEGYGVTLDFVCYSCHKDSLGVGGAQFQLPLLTASGVARQMHTAPPTTPEYVGSEACRGCHNHEEQYESVSAMGHPHALTAVSGLKPGDPLLLPDNPPAGLAWSDLKYVIGGWGWKALFVNNSSQIVTGGDAQYNIPTPQFDSGASAPADTSGAFEYGCFRCHTTGATPGQEAFHEAGVGCEACHGPGNRHIVTGNSADIRKDTGVCVGCHTNDQANHHALAKGGFLTHNQQAEELRMGAHGDLAAPSAPKNCTDCHDPMVGIRRGQSDGIVKDCASAGCHPNKPFTHVGVVDGRPIVCMDCHMPRATLSARSLNRYTADVRTHVFKIHGGPEDQTSMFVDNGGKTELRSDISDYGVTLDFVCYTCHKDAQGVGGLKSTKTLAELAARAPTIHESKMRAAR